jgi:hypothetical protein
MLNRAKNHCLGGLQPGAGLEKIRLTKIARMVVGHRKTPPLKRKQSMKLIKNGRAMSLQKGKPGRLGKHPFKITDEL